ncbi:hypothetical protein P872_11750 [Rhodonellum psychrophilum GCM71 = DSM 17998]|uniref:Lipopolysaccharide biosynthesis protein n=2 Tax=Rhodonellum TaxID=336827 RepID=U5BTX0_9BACT|nr:MULTISPECIES: glycoside hydrolase family 99-like domain-containing protein [Rhodonellum]ERM80974.1 hypothetical protein P872_11750 [Rhodonellum psychrophilum GCM71 = DSM 17998]SDZ55385.1 Glycosyltransferase WbsX [Rhodonellum ikkaensis]
MKLFAYFLPQFHPTPENNQWWGNGFTEWTNVTKASPFFPGHQQPKLPADLGFYDLRIPEVMEEQAKIAMAHGVDGFVFYHYWFGDGKVMLEKPIQQFLKNHKVDIQFCMCWANESWKGTWHGAGNRLLIEQKYLGKEDYLVHFQYLLPFFEDKRSLKIEGKPVFQVYAPESIPDLDLFLATFNEQALLNGLPGIFWIAVKSSPKWNAKHSKFDGMVNPNLSQINKYLTKSISGFFLRYGLNNPIIRRVFRLPKTIFFHSVRACLEDFKENYSIDFFPLAIPNWDNTPRTKNLGTVYLQTNPKAFGEHLKACLKQARKNQSDRKIVFIKSWNEWAEGNFLEPDQKFGKSFLEVIKSQKS